MDTTTFSDQTMSNNPEFRCPNCGARLLRSFSRCPSCLELLKWDDIQPILPEVHQPVDMPQEPSPGKKNRHSGVLLTIVVTIVVMTIAGVFGREFARILFGKRVNQTSNIQSPLKPNDWITVSIGNPALVFRSPGKMQRIDPPLPENVRQIVDSIESYRYSTSGLELIASRVTYVAGTTTNLDGAVEGMLTNWKLMRGVTISQYHVDKTTVSGFPARLLTGAMLRGGVTVDFQAIIFANGLHFAQVLALIADPNATAQAKETLQSVRMHQVTSPSRQVNETLPGNLYRNKEHRFRIRFPQGWQIKDPDGEHIVTKAELHNTSQINILVRPITEITSLEQLSRSEQMDYLEAAVTPAIEHLDGQLVEKSVKYINNRPALYAKALVTYKRLAGDFPAINEQYMLIQNGTLYMITTTCLRTDYSDLKSTIYRSVGSFVIEDWD